MRPQCVCPWCRRIQMAATNLWYEPAEVAGSAEVEALLLTLPDAICPECSQALLDTLDFEGSASAQDGTSRDD
jgi:hypothetical protein